MLAVRRRGGDVGECRVRVAVEGQVADADDAHDLAVLDHRQPPHRLLSHDLYRAPHRIVGGNGGQVVARDVADAGGTRVATFRDHPHDEVAIGQDPGQVAVVVGHHHVADI